MKNLHEFLSEHSNCIACSKSIFTEMIITFDAFTQKGSVPFKLHIDYIRDEETEACFRYIKYRDDNDRKYDPSFDKAANSMVVSRNGSFMFDNNIYSPYSYLIYGNCSDDHICFQTKEVYINSEFETNKDININREEIQVQNYRIVNDYTFNTTKVYVDGKFPARLNLKLIPSYSIKKNAPYDIVSKIESLLILT